MKLLDFLVYFSSCKPGVGECNVIEDMQTAVTLRMARCAGLDRYPEEYQFAMREGWIKMSLDRNCAVLTPNGWYMLRQFKGDFT